MIKVPLTQGMFAIIDPEDQELVGQFKWHYSKSSKNYGKARASLGARGKTITMHRLILNAPSGMEVDHVNGNPLDNRRSNLRLVTHAQNQRNMGKHTDGKSKFLGVSWHEKAKKWQVHVRLNNKNTYLGLFMDEIEAARAYNAAASKDPFKRLNKTA